jgi:hypothetical protein
MTILMGGDLQATPAKESERSYYSPLNLLCEATGLIQVNPKDIYTFIPAKTHIHHWLPRQPLPTQHYTTHDIQTTTHTPEYGDHKALKLELP